MSGEFSPAPRSSPHASVTEPAEPLRLRRRRVPRCGVKEVQYVSLCATDGRRVTFTTELMQQGGNRPGTFHVRAILLKHEISAKERLLGEQK